MNVNFRMIIFWTTLVLCISQSTAWWWRSSDPSPQDMPPYLPPAVYYQQRLLKTHPVNLPPQYGPQGGGDPAAGTVTVPAIPIQVPLQAQLAPMPNVHNVQLVPCLCPVQQEDYHEKPMDAVYNSKKDV